MSERFGPLHRRPGALRRGPYPATPLNGSAQSPRALALPAPISTFRLPGGGGEPFWIGDDMGGVVDPGDPHPSRRDFLIRVAVAAGALTVGGAINVLTTALVAAQR